jgi:hypothetical protein
MLTVWCAQRAGRPDRTQLRDRWRAVFVLRYLAAVVLMITGVKLIPN